MVQKSDSIGAGVRFSRYVYVILAMILAACIMGQIFIAGMAVFGSPADWKLHVAFVRYFQYLPILLIIFGFTGRLSRELRWMPFGLIVLLVIQYVTANLANLASGYIAAIHPVTGMGMFLLAMNIVRKSWPAIFMSDKAVQQQRKSEKEVL